MRTSVGKVMSLLFNMLTRFVIAFLPRRNQYFVPSHSVMFDFLQPHVLSPARLLWPWYFSGKNIRVGCHALHQGIFLTQGLNPYLSLYRQILYYLSHQGSPSSILSFVKMELIIGGRMVSSLKRNKHIKYFGQYLMHCACPIYICCTWTFFLRKKRELQMSIIF